MLAGGTEEQKQEWLPKLASTEVMAAVAVTEPDFGSDVAGVKVTATPTDGGWLINGVKTWCTFGARANVLMLLARTDPDRSVKHRGLSLFVVPKEIGDAEGFEFVDDRGGKMEGRPIDTIGYRGMHSYEIAFDNWFVASREPGRRRRGRRAGLLLPDGRLRERALANRGPRRRRDAGRVRGRARQYAHDRAVFGQSIFEYQLTQAKLGRMVVPHPDRPAVRVPGGSTHRRGRGRLEASMVKAYVCKAAEWVTREAMQIHGGYRLRRGVHGQPLLRRRPRAVDLRRRRRDPLPQGHRPPPRRGQRLTPPLTGRPPVRVLGL